MVRRGLTRQGWTLAGASAGLLVGSQLLGADGLAVVGLTGLGLLVASFGWVSRGAAHVTVTRTLTPVRAHVGDDAQAMLTITPMVGHGGALALTDPFDGGPRAARFLVMPGQVGTPVRAWYRLPTIRRGRHHVGPAVVSRTDPLGLARRVEVVGGTSVYLVRPRVHPLRAPRASGRDLDRERRGRAHVLDPSALDDFLSLRPYEMGDDLRHVHWRSTARVDELVVRQDEASRRGRAVVMLDTRSPVDDEAFERAVEVAASVVAAMRRSGQALELVTSAGTMLGYASADAMLDRLADVEPGEPDRFASVAAALRRQRPDLVIAALTALDAVAAATLESLATVTEVRAVVSGAQVARPRGVAVVDATDRPLAEAWSDAVPSPRSRSRR